VAGLLTPTPRPNPAPNPDTEAAHSQWLGPLVGVTGVRFTLFACAYVYVCTYARNESGVKPELTPLTPVTPPFARLVGQFWSWPRI